MTYSLKRAHPKALESVCLSRLSPSPANCDIVTKGGGLGRGDCLLVAGF
jgi:hypothetical protein